MVEVSGGLAHTTNNIMEMIAALEGLRALPSGSRACIVTDSRYLHDGMTSWMAGWKRKDWKTASGDPVKNKEIWVQLDAASSDHEQVRWHWVKGHIGHALNERATCWRSPPRGTPLGPRADIWPRAELGASCRPSPASRFRSCWTERGSTETVSWCSFAARAVVRSRGQMAATASARAEARMSHDDRPSGEGGISHGR